MPISKDELEVLSPPAREAFICAQKKAEAGDDYELRAFLSLRDYPVGIEEFITNPDYMGSEAVYPAVLEELIELNNPQVQGRKYRSRLWTTYSEAILTGAIGVGKSTIAIYSMAYQVYLLSCFRSPHVIYELDPASEIAFVFQNRTERLAKTVDYDRFKAMIDGSPYFQKHFRFDHRVKSELRFPNRIVVRPLSGADTASIGQNIFSAIIDEVNFFENVERSTRSLDGRAYDQASTLYDSIARRRASRFQKRGRLPGLLCLVSSRRYPGQFTDVKEQERQRQLERTGTTSIYLYDKRLWDIKPEGTYSGEYFSVFGGDLTRKPRLLGNDEQARAHDDHLIIDVPVEHRPEFERDILNALRDVAGISTTAIHPFLTNRDAVAACFSDRRSLVTCDEVVLGNQSLAVNVSQAQNPQSIHWAHLDLSMTGDATGIVIGHVSHFRKVSRGEHIEVLPFIYIDLVLRVVPPSDGEIRYDQIRELLYRLRRLGVNIRFVTADSFQSTDMLQTLQRNGFCTGRQSMDRTIVPFEILKSALYDRRLDISYNETLQRELLSLEVDAKSGKIDHPPSGSKDLADALAGVVFGLSRRLEVWYEHGINPHHYAPSFVSRIVGQMAEARPESN
jgi:hypothetical protein